VKLVELMSRIYRTWSRKNLICLLYIYSFIYLFIYLFIYAFVGFTATVSTHQYWKSGHWNIMFSCVASLCTHLKRLKKFGCVKQLEVDWNEIRCFEMLMDDQRWFGWNGAVWSAGTGGSWSVNGPAAGGCGWACGSLSGLHWRELQGVACCCPYTYFLTELVANDVFS
jgi:hypothetical protein